MLGCCHYAQCCCGHYHSGSCYSAQCQSGERHTGNIHSAEWYYGILLNVICSEKCYFAKCYLAEFTIAKCFSDFLPFDRVFFLLNVAAPFAGLASKNENVST